MWPDNDTDLDFLNFGGLAGTVAEIITQAQGRPISIGVSGSWGTGKSSMMRLVRKALAPDVFDQLESSSSTASSSSRFTECGMPG